MRKSLSHLDPKFIWKLNLLSKIKIFQWLVIRDILPYEFLIARRLEITNKCHFYNKNTDHIFKYCPFIQET